MKFGADTLTSQDLQQSAELDLTLTNGEIYNM